MNYKTPGEYVGTIGVTPFSTEEERHIRQALGGRIGPGDDGKQVFTHLGQYRIETEKHRVARRERK